jgi:hypothetical protein
VHRRAVRFLRRGGLRSELFPALAARMSREVPAAQAGCREITSQKVTAREPESVDARRTAFPDIIRQWIRHV